MAGGIASESGKSSGPLERRTCDVQRQVWGEFGSQPVYLYMLKVNNLEVDITNFGATITRILQPDSKGNIADVVLGFDELKPYTDGTSPNFGCIVGRVANRIAGAQFTLDGKTYKLFPNDPPNTLHGGKIGYDKVLWASSDFTSANSVGVLLTYHSKDGEEGFPGDVEVSVRYTLFEGGELQAEIHGKALNKPTPFNLANHSYFNLAGHASGPVYHQTLQLNADLYTPVDAHSIPTGEVLSVKGTPFDFLTPTPIGSRINDVPPIGYDHNYVVNRPGAEFTLTLAAKARDPKSGRVLEVHTSGVPAVQLYTGNNLNGSFKGKDGYAYQKHDAFCLETQAFPNAINTPGFPSVVISPDHPYLHVIKYKFSAQQL